MDYPYDLGPYSRKVTTTSADAQRWFDRGLNWCFGYHHEEAVACFEKALEADPNCAMAQWGVGFAAGPNYNFPWELMDPTGEVRTSIGTTERANMDTTNIQAIKGEWLLRVTLNDAAGRYHISWTR